MLSLTDFVDNLENECKSIHYVKQSYVLEKYTEDDLCFFESENSMNDNNLFLFKKDDEIELCVIEDFDRNLCDKFPILLNPESFFNRSSTEYKFYETGFGGVLCVKNLYYEIFNTELTKVAKENKMDFHDDQPSDMFVHGYWITIAKKILQK